MANDFDLCSGARGPLENSGCPYPHVSGGLVTYLDSVDGDRREGDHFTTTGGVSPAYRFQANLGFLLNQRLAGTVPLYSCTTSRDQFLSRDPACGGAKVLGAVGYAYAQRPQGLPTRAIYRCRSSDGEQFVAAKPTCRRSSDRNLGLLGYTSLTPLPR